mmetsp:Transcript_2718/g.8166  ORF Transcript_2718/g.8166 Transcript_2718/m.8166 type:complete len:222 (+) Transcript_2718:1202-1867(+)
MSHARVGFVEARATGTRGPARGLCALEPSGWVTSSWVSWAEATRGAQGSRGVDRTSRPRGASAWRVDRTLVRSSRPRACSFIAPVLRRSRAARPRRARPGSRRQTRAGIDHRIGHSVDRHATRARNTTGVVPGELIDATHQRDDVAALERWLNASPDTRQTTWTLTKALYAVDDNSRARCNRVRQVPSRQWGSSRFVWKRRSRNGAARRIERLQHGRHQTY